MKLFLLFVVAVGLTACTKDDDKDSQGAAPSTAEELVVGIETQHPDQEQLVEKRITRTDPNVPISSEPCTTLKTVTTNLYTSNVGTYEKPAGEKVRLTRSCVVVLENGKEVKRWTYWKDQAGNYYAPDKVYTKCAGYKYQSCNYRNRKYSHKYKIETVKFYLNDQSKAGAKCADLAIEKDGICDDGKIVWKAKDAKVVNPDDYQSLSCTEAGKATVYSGCVDYDQNIYPVGTTIRYEYFYSTNFCSKKQGCNAQKTIVCQTNGEVGPTQAWDNYKEKFTVDEAHRILIPNSVYVWHGLAGRDIAQIGACGDYLYAVINDETSVRGEKYKSQGLYVIGQRDKADNVEDRRPSVAKFNNAIFTYIDGLSCIDHHYLAGYQRVMTDTSSMIGAHTDLFIIDLDRINKINGQMMAISSSRGFTKDFKDLPMSVPHFRDQAPLTPVSDHDVQLGTVPVIHGKNQLTALFFNKDTFIVTGTAEFDSQGVGTSNALILNGHQLDPQYSAQDRYGATSVWEVNDKSGTFYVVKKKFGTSDPIIERCLVSVSELTCTPVEIKNITFKANTDFTILGIEDAPYLVAWNAKTGVIENVYQFNVDATLVLDGAKTKLAAKKFAAVKSLAKTIVENKLPHLNRTVFTAENKVYELTFNNANNIVAANLSAATMAKDDELNNYAYLADLAPYAATIKAQLGDNTEIIAAKANKPFYYLYVRPANYMSVVFKAEPEGLQELIQTFEQVFEK